MTITNAAIAPSAVSIAISRIPDRIRRPAGTRSTSCMRAHVPSGSGVL